MIEDLIFKGKNLQEALNKAGNFFGVNINFIRYETLEDSPNDEIWIKLTENPILAQKRGGSAGQEVQKQYSYNKNESYQYDNRTGRATFRPRPNRQHMSRQEYNRRGGSGQGRKGRKNYRDRGSHNKRDNWKREEQDLSGLSEVEREIYQFVANILAKMKLRVDLIPTLDQSRLILNIDGPDRNLLLAKKGEPLVSIQYLVNKIFMGRREVEQPVYIDSMGYRIARDEELHDIALSSAEKVRKSGKEYSLSPMNPYERRQIHVALKDDETVDTISRGDGYIKRVSIIPVENAAKSEL